MALSPCDARTHAVDEMRMLLDERPVGPRLAADRQPRMARDDLPRRRGHARIAARRVFVVEGFLHVERERHRVRGVVDGERRDRHRARALGRHDARGIAAADGHGGRIAMGVGAGLTDGGALLERVDRLIVAHHLDLPCDRGRCGALRMGRERDAREQDGQAVFQHETSPETRGSGEWTHILRPIDLDGGVTGRVAAGSQHDPVLIER